MPIKLTEDEVKKSVRSILESLESSGDCVWFERLNSGKVKTDWGSWLRLCRPGTPDFMCICINKNKNISVIFIETKKTGGKRSHEQNNFISKYVKHVDIHYFTIVDPRCLSSMILEIAYDRVQAIDFI